MPPTQDVKPFADVPLRLDVVIGTTMIRIHELFRLREGSTVMTSRPVGDPLDLALQGVLLARVEVIGPSESASVRVMEILVDPE